MHSIQLQSKDFHEMYLANRANMHLKVFSDSPFPYVQDITLCPWQCGSHLPNWTSHDIIDEFPTFLAYLHAAKFSK